MTDLHLPAPYPLAWPQGRARTPAGHRRAGCYAVHAYEVAAGTLEREIERWSSLRRETRITEWQLTASHAGRRSTTSKGKADDPGASLWFVLGGQAITAGRNLMVMACDKFDALPQNVRALELTMSRLRLVDDIGAYSLVQAVEGARALPAPERVIDWRATFGLVGQSPWSIEVVDQIYRGLAREAGEGNPRLVDLNLAIEAARRELKG